LVQAGSGKQHDHADVLDPAASLPEGEALLKASPDAEVAQDELARFNSWQLVRQELNEIRGLLELDF